jgi:hypothetical protein
VALAALLFGTAAFAQSFAVISDINGRYGSTFYHERVAGAVARIGELEPAAVLSAGDLVAGQKQPRLDREWLDRMWQGFDDVVGQPLEHAQIPLLPTPGNHDGSAYPAFELERERFAQYWSGREPAALLTPASEWPRRYAARVGDALLIAFDGTRPGALPAEELNFIGAMLERHGAAAGCTLVLGHLPMWPLARGRESDIIADPVMLELLHRHGVDAYLSGHHHVYYPGVDEAGMLHLAVGALGGNARAFSGQQERQPHSFALLECVDGVVRTRALRAPRYDAQIPGAGLPAVVSGPLGTLRRLDGDLPLRP